MMSKMIIVISVITTTMKHPISMGSMLMIQTILVSNKIFKESNMSWFAYILFITIIGGMMIMFMYMSSIASNEKFSVTMKQLMLMTIIIAMTMIMMSESSMEQFNKILEKKELMIQKEETMYSIKFFNLNKMNLTIITMIILLLTMIIVTNIASTFEGPLKKTYV
uniref:NADH-ubiquinone oxidoreductase chain 6 n=1 Tax=Ricania speculum TaxID=1902407 RepID=A0A1C9JBZ6_9HEMI|nr:NADH dehydrogenase subunit 6 [Ricania speculum]AOP19362.1 NADH dehydrogenase subunit 6 [Ricania speculum]QNV47328.1 NADH dehydrogenase subunit 6 [Ricania speculum]